MSLEELLPWIAGAVGVPVINWIKAQLNFRGRAAVWLTVGVSLVLAFVSLLVTQELTLADFVMESILASFSQVLAAATLIYKLLLAENPQPK